ncbi:MAG: hypothetical protein ACOX7P_05230 [Oscillospiraceae bacterium]
MALAGLIVSIMVFLMFFIFLNAATGSVLLCVLFAAAAIAGIVITGLGYDRSYKAGPRSIKAQKDKLKLMTSCLLDFLIVLVAYNIVFRRPGIASLFYSLPYIFIVLAFLWLVGFLTIRLKISSLSRNIRKQIVCAACGEAVNPSAKYCGSCGRKIRD